MHTESSRQGRRIVLSVLFLLFIGWNGLACQRSWTYTPSGDRCSPWQNQAQANQLNTLLSEATTPVEQAGWLGCIVLSRNDKAATYRLARLHTDGTLWSWNGSDFQRESLSIPSNATETESFRFQFYGLRYPILDHAKKHSTRNSSTIQSLLRVTETDVCRLLDATSYKTCLQDGQLCQFMVEFRPTSDNRSLVVASLSKEIDGVQKQGTEQCALFMQHTLTPERPPEPASEPKPEPVPDQQEPKPEPKPEPTPEPFIDSSAGSLCATNCQWKQRLSLSVVPGPGQKVEGPEQIASNHDGTKFVFAWKKYNMRFQRVSDSNYQIVQGPSWHGSYSPSRNTFNPQGTLAARLRDLSNSDGFFLQIGAFETYFRNPYHSKTSTNAKTLIGGGFRFDSKRFLIVDEACTIHFFNSTKQFAANSQDVQGPQGGFIRNCKGFHAKIHPTKDELILSMAPTDQTDQFGLVRVRSAGLYVEAKRISTTAKVDALAYHPNGTTILAGQSDGSLWQYSDTLDASAEIKPKLEPLPRTFHRIAFSKDKRLMATLETPQSKTGRTDLRMIRLWVWDAGSTNTLQPYRDIGMVTKEDGTQPLFANWGDFTFGSDCNTLILGANTQSNQIQVYSCQ
jgi:hypothetical protein